MFNFRSAMRAANRIQEFEKNLKWRNLSQVFIVGQKGFLTMLNRYPKAFNGPEKRFRLIDTASNDNGQFDLFPWYVKINSQLYENVENFITRCRENGVTEFLQKQQFPKVWQYQKDGPQVLTMQILSAGFYVWIGTICIAVLIFVLEIFLYGLEMLCEYICSIMRIIILT